MDFERFWADVELDLLAIAQRYLDTSAAADVVQDVAVLFLYRLQKRPAILPNTEHGCHVWLKRKVRWRALDELRRRRRFRDLLEHEQTSVQIDPSQCITLKEDVDQVLAVAEGLPPRQRQVMQRYLVGEPTDVIGEAMGIAESSVRSLLRFARAAIARHLDPNEAQK